MKRLKLIVIGGDAAGMSAASKVRREQPDREIIVFERGRHTSYIACGIPYFIGGQVRSSDSLIARKAEVFRKKQNIDVRLLHEVIEIDIPKKEVKVRDLKNNSVFKESWDDLLIATGAKPAVPETDGADAKGVFAISSLESGIDIHNYLEEKSPEKAVVVGGGYIGIEMAEAFLSRNISVTLLDMAPQVMTTMDADMAGIIAEYMKKSAVNICLSEKLVKIEKSNSGAVSSVITDKQSVEAQIVIIGTGTIPESELATGAGIETGVNKAIRVNKKQETSVPDIWAAGDCAESFNIVTGRQVHIPLGTVANKQGVVAGTNISGGDTCFPGTAGTAITRFKDLEIARTGLSEKEAKELGVNYKTAKIEGFTRAGFYPGAGNITVKLLIEMESGIIKGGQIIGETGAGKRIDIISAAITAKMNAKQLVDLDLAYAPPFSTVWDPVQIAARKLI